MNIIKKYNYIPLQRNSDSGTRVYNTPDGDLPSVTSILAATKDKTGLDNWRKAVGDKEADRISKESTDLGTLMHSHIEAYIEKTDRPKGNNIIRKQAAAMADVIIDHGLININEIWGVEVGLYYPNLYAGTTDLVGIHNGSEAIMDHKSTNKLKKLEYVEDYFFQGIAYANAHDHHYGTKINKVVLFMASRALEYQEWILEGTQFFDMQDKWYRKIEEYYK